VGVGSSLIAIAVGAILDFAVKVQNNHGFNINRIGLIVMILGIVGLVISLFFWNSWGGFGGSSRRRVVTSSNALATTYGGQPGGVVQQPLVGQQPMVPQEGTTYVEEQEQRY
jgi:hypothetical protein